jgi:hypothetical protein
MSKGMRVVEDVEISNSKHETDPMFTTLTLPPWVTAAAHGSLCRLPSSQVTAHHLIKLLTGW